MSDAGSTRKTSLRSRPFVPPSSSKSCLCSSRTLIFLPLLMCTCEDASCLCRTALDHDRRPLAEATGSQHRDVERAVGRRGVGECDETALQPAQVAHEYASHVALEQDRAVHGDGGLCRVTLAGLFHARLDVGPCAECLFLVVGLRNHRGVEAGAAHHCEPQVVAGPRVDRSPVATNDQLDDVVGIRRKVETCGEEVGGTGGYDCQRAVGIRNGRGCGAHCAVATAHDDGVGPVLDRFARRILGGRS